MSRKKYITDIDGNVMTCMLCGADAWYDTYEDRFEFDCPCGEIDVSLLPIKFWEDLEG